MTVSVVAAARTATIDRRRLYMLPTGAGLYFAFAVAAMLLVAVNYNNGLAYLFTFLLGAMAMVSMLVTHRNAVGLSLGASPVGPVFAGTAARFRVLVSNPDRQRHGIWLRCGRALQVVEPPPQGVAEVEFQVPTARRGYCRLPALTLSTGYPFGLFFTWSRPTDLDSRAIVFPLPSGDRPLPGPHDDRGIPGPRAAGDDFSALREYRLGDHPGHVHWKAAARGELLTKVFEGSSSDSELLLDWYALEGLDSEARIGQLCRWLLDAEHAGLRYGLRTPADIIAAGRGDRHLDRCLTALALIEPLAPEPSAPTP